MSPVHPDTNMTFCRAASHASASPRREKKLKHKQTQKANIKRLRELSLQELRLENADL